MERTVAIIKPHAVTAGNAEKLVEIIEHNGFYINRRKEATITKDSASQLFADRKDTDGFNELVNSVSSGTSVVLVLSKIDAVRGLLDLAGPSSVKVAKAQCQSSLRAMFGEDGPGQNAIEPSASAPAAEAEIEHFFPAGAMNKLPAKEYLLETVMPGLVEALTDMCLVKPADPYDWLQNWLSQNRPRQGVQQCSTAVLDGHVVCADQFDGIEKTDNAEPSIWNLRRANNRAGIFGVGQATIPGMQYTSEYMRTQGYTNVVWANLRDEPVVYVNGEPVALRPEDAVGTRPSYFPKDARKLVAMEARLRRDLFSSAGVNKGELGIFRQVGGSHELNQVKIEKVSTMDDAFQQLQKEVAAREEAAQNWPPAHPILEVQTPITCRYGSTEDMLPAVVQAVAEDGTYDVLFEDGEAQSRTENDIQWPEPEPLAAPLARVDYWRLPISDESAPTPADIDNLASMLRKVSIGSGTALLFSSHTGFERATTGMVAACIVFHIQHGWQQDSICFIDKDAPDTSKGEFPSVIELVQAMNNGLEMKALVDQSLGECASDMHQAMSEAANPSAQCWILQQRYCYLILFAAYMRSGSSASFEQWLTPQLSLTRILSRMHLE